MIYLFAINLCVPFLQCAMISQAAPLMGTQGSQNSPELATNLQVQIPAPIQPASLQLDPSTSIPTHSVPAANNHLPAADEPGLCAHDPEAVSCPPECKPPEKPKHVETGWINGLKNLFTVCFKAFTTNLLGEQGKRTTKRRKESNSSDGNGNGGRTTACCIFNQSGPPVKHDEYEDKNETNEQTPSVNCFLIKNKVRGSVHAGAAGLITPGAKTNAKNRTINFGCVGSSMFIVKNFIRVHIKPQFNCCACVVNVHGVEKS